MSAGPFVVPLPPSSSGSSANVASAASASTALEFCGRGGLGYMDLTDKIRPSVVVRRTTPAGRGGSADSPTRPAILVRRIGPRLGGPSFRPICFGPVVKEEKHFYQYPGTLSYQVGPPGISTSDRRSQWECLRTTPQH